jgi:AmmeMemoRadiSam system protein B
MIRNPAVAGHFYPGERDILSLEVEKLSVPLSKKKEDAIGMVLPHAGYMYSGAVAGAVIASVNSRPIYIIMGPNHTGLGSPFSVSASDAWKTPLGDVNINTGLTEEILKDCRLIHKDEFAHVHEHSIEVQLPFLQKLDIKFTFVPIVVAAASIEVYRKIGESLANSIRGLGIEKDVSIIASSDMTHYEPREEAKEKDFKALDAILKLDEEALIKRVQELDITMCGFAPIAIMIAAAKKLGAKNARLVKYQTSGDVSGDNSSVVGYAGVIIN